MRNFLKKHHYIFISMGINILLILFAVFIFGTRYATDDDISIARIAYGVFFEAQSRVVFSGTAFGALLKLLSELIPRVNWQIIIYYFALFFGGAALGSFVIKQRNRGLVTLWALVVVIFYYSVYVDINFSLISGMLAFYGYGILFLGAYEKNITATVLSIVPLSFSVIIRYDSFLGISFFAFFTFVMVCIVKRKMLKSLFISFVIGLSIPIALLISDKLAYTSLEWKEYLEYDNYRYHILDFHSVLDLSEDSYFEDIGLTEEMVASLKKWQFNDTEVFNREVMARMSEDSKNLFPKVSVDTIFESLGYCVEKTCKLSYFLFAVLVLALLTVKRDLSGKNRISVFVMPWLVILPYILEMATFYYLDRGIDRVLRTVALGLWCGIFTLFSCEYFEEDSEQNTENKSFAIGCIIMVVVSILCQFDNLKDIRGFQRVDLECVDQSLEFLNDGRIYMCDVGALREIENAYGVWNIPQRNALYNCVELGGWLVNYPQAIKKQDALGVNNPYKSLAYNSNVYLLTTEEGETQLQFLKSAYDSDIESEFVEEHGKVSVYKYKVK